MTKTEVPLDVHGEQIEPGMSRFLNAQNLERYRKLAGGVTTAAERQKVLELLANEMSAFRNELKINDRLEVAQTSL